MCNKVRQIYLAALKDKGKFYGPDEDGRLYVVICIDNKAIGFFIWTGRDDD